MQGLHPRLVTEGFDAAKNKALEILEQIKIKQEMDRDILVNVARTSLRTKVHPDLADLLTEVCFNLDRFRMLLFNAFCSMWLTLF
jgi:T-complex protein 1 subunit zeta